MLFKIYMLYKMTPPDVYRVLEYAKFKFIPFPFDVYTLEFVDVKV
jgi:hypothetical protein